ncbi:MAG TPA: enolase C-terminal domain-like protein [Fimbriimonas sp.]
MAPSHQPLTNSRRVTVKDARVRELNSQGHRQQMVEVEGDNGFVGYSAPILSESAFIAGSRLRDVVVGQDAMATRAVWDAMKLSDRHSRAGAFMMAMSAIDIALWDLKGKTLGCSVSSLLGGPVRSRVPVYASLLGFPTEPKAARKVAREFLDRGFGCQKWFFDHGPQDGPDGFRKNVRLAMALREELGEDAEIYFDAKWAWDVPYAIRMARAIEEMNPGWLEEPLRSENVSGYEAIQAATTVPLAAGEHLYSRWEVKEYLDRGVLGYLQTDPEWCGGITELVRICSFAETYGVPVCPHGHHLWAALHVIAAHPARVCPKVEYLFKYMPDKLRFHKPRLEPKEGWIEVPGSPGLGFEIDSVSDR